MPSSAALWRGYLSRNKRSSSRRPRGGAITNGAQASTRLGGVGLGKGATSNAVAGTNIAVSKDQGRHLSGGHVL